MRLGLLVLVLLVPIADAASVDARLTLADGFSFSEATLVSGRVAFDPPDVTEVSLLEARAFVLPPGQLVACPAPSGSGGQAPQDPTTGRCRGGEAFEDAQVSFGPRTRLLLNGSFRVTRFPEATLGAFVPDPAGARWAAASSPDGFALAWDADALEFRSVGRAASIIVTVEGEPRWFNGSAHVFTFLPEADGGAVDVTAEGLAARVPTSLRLTVLPAASRDVSPLVEPRRLLDAQEAVLGADAREPIRNVTAVLGSFSRAPVLLDAALVGHLNGTFGREPTDPAEVTLVRLNSLDATLEDGVLSGRADARLVVEAKGFARVEDDPSSPPWWLAGLAWLIALVTFAAVPWAAPTRARWAWVLRLAAVLVSLVAWDALMARAIGFSAGSLRRAGASFETLAPVGAFELIALVLAWLAVGLPLRLAAGRLLRRRAPRWSVAAPLVGLAAVLVLLAALPHAVLNLALRVAHL